MELLRAQYFRSYVTPTQPDAPRRHQVLRSENITNLFSIKLIPQPPPIPLIFVLWSASLRLETTCLDPLTFKSRVTSGTGFLRARLPPLCRERLKFVGGASLLPVSGTRGLCLAFLRRFPARAVSGIRVHVFFIPRAKGSLEASLGRYPPAGRGAGCHARNNITR